jgi:DNA-binding transcriptional MerR regulator
VGTERRRWHSGELAKLAGVSPDTLRLYERRGVLPKAPRSSNGYRSYPPEALERVHLVRAALSIGFTLDELAGILGRRDAGGAPCAQVRDLAREKLRNLEEHLRRLIELRDRLRKVLKQWDVALESTPPTERARLLEALAATVPPGERNLLPQLVPSLTKPRHKEHDDD